MDVLDFCYFVLPLGFLVFLMVSITFYYARRDEKAQRRIIKLVNSYVKTTSKQKQSYNKQLSKLQELLKNESIDEVTYERMKRALENSYTKKREEAKMRLSSTQGKNRMSADANTEYADTET